MSKLLKLIRDAEEQIRLQNVSKRELTPDQRELIANYSEIQNLKADYMIGEGAITDEEYAQLIIIEEEILNQLNDTFDAG